MLLESLQQRVLADRGVGAAYQAKPEDLPDLDNIRASFTEHLAAPIGGPSQTRDERELMRALGLRR